LRSIGVMGHPSLVYWALCYGVDPGCYAVDPVCYGDDPVCYGDDPV
jgi:hypothetical protein